MSYTLVHDMPLAMLVNVMSTDRRR